MNKRSLVLIVVIILYLSGCTNQNTLSKIENDYTKEVNALNERLEDLVTNYNTIKESYITAQNKASKDINKVKLCQTKLTSKVISKFNVNHNYFILIETNPNKPVILTLTQQQYDSVEENSYYVFTLSKKVKVNEVILSTNKFNNEIIKKLTVTDIRIKNEDDTIGINDELKCMGVDYND